MEYHHAKSQWRSFVILCILSAVMTVTGFSLLVGAKLLTNEAYEDFVEISPATEAALRKNSYLRAIRLCPDREIAYLKLLALYSEDGAYSKSESEEFLALYNSNQKGLTDKAFATLNAQVGLVYINGYDGTTQNRFRLAYSFLDKAYPHLSKDDALFDTVSCYKKICQYYSEYIWNASAIKDVTPQDAKDLIEDIETALDNFLKQEKMNAYDFLGFCLAVTDLLYDQRDILAITVPQERVFAILDRVYSNLPDKGYLSKEQTQALYNTLITNEDICREMLNRAYQRVGGDLT